MYKKNNKKNNSINNHTNDNNKALTFNYDILQNNLYISTS